MDYNRLFDQISRNSIKLGFEFDEKAELPVGASKFGGNPDLPEGFQWYYHEGENFEGIIQKRPLSFFAQINCDEIKEYDQDGLLPKRGMLYFFYELSTMTWGFDPKDKGSARVFYFDGEVKELHRTDFPYDLENEFRLPEIRLSFHKKYDLPCYEEYAEVHDYDDWDEYEEARVLKGYEQEDEISKLLGYADIIQNSMLLQCEKVTSGIYCGGIPEIEQEQLEQMQENCSQWQLLLQLDTVTADGFELMFGDCGRIYFYIKKDDLKARNFDQCWLILQCS